MTPRLPGGGSCTGCGACVAACPRSCVSLAEDGARCLVSRVDAEGCVGCGRCEAVCHALNPPALNARSGRVYAVRALAEGDRRRSASGGVAAALYRWALSRGVCSYGVPSDDLFGYRFVEIEGDGDVERCRNSKYVQSDMRGVFASAAGHLRAGGGVLFVGLPCQVSALRRFCAPDTRGTLYCVDIICHGVCPASYLEQHVATVEKRKGRNAGSLSFRDPAYGTQAYAFTLGNEGTAFYTAGPRSGDEYQAGYHQALTYRECCYACAYARPERAGDLTIGDFSGYGRLAERGHGFEETSCVIVSSPLGDELLEGMARTVPMDVEERPADEAFLYERQLRSPSVRHPRREVFERAIRVGKPFDSAVREAVRGALTRDRLATALRLGKAREALVRAVPPGVRTALKRLIGRR